MGAITDEDGVVTPTDPDPPGATARQLFDKNIYPTLHDKCGSSACHAQSNRANGAFVADMASAGYDLAVNEAKLVPAFTPQAPILTKIAGGHYTTYSPADIAAITKWLAQEATERGNQKDFLREFSGCMDFGEFQTTKMPEAWANEPTQDAGVCVNCHVTGGFNFYASDVEQQFFDAITRDRSRLSKYFTVDDAKTKVIMNLKLFESVGTSTPAHPTHATWDYINGNAVATLKQYYELTMSHVAAGNCPPPRF